MTVADTNAANNSAAPEFNASQIAHVQELHTLVKDTEVQGNTARVSQAFALHELNKSEGWKAVLSETTGAPFPSWSAYLEETTPTLSAAAASKGLKVVSLLGKEDPARLAQAGLEKLYMCIGLVDKDIIKLDQVVDFAINNTNKQLRALAEGSGAPKDQKFPLVDFTVTKSMQDRMEGVLHMFGEALKVAGNGAEASDWQKVDAMLETVATLDREYIIETVSGVGGNGPRTATTFTDTPPAEVINWVADTYIKDGHDPEEVFTLIQGALTSKIQEAKDAKAAEEAARKAREADEAKQAKATEANRNKLIRMSANIRVTGSDGGIYFVKEVFKDQGENGQAFITVERDGILAVPEDGTMMDLSDIAAIVVELEKVKPAKAEKPIPEPASEGKFSKAAQAGKGRGSKKAAAKK